MWRNIICEGGADCDIERYMGVEKVRERLLISKQVAQNFDVEKYHL